jgi:hypothetical protein
MKKIGWKVLGTESDRRVAEVRADEVGDTLSSYDEAKREAIQSLWEHAEPYLRRIQELEQDRFQVLGALPLCKAWRSRTKLVTAKTKKRAIELLGRSRYSFDADFSEAGGDWWYHLAGEEAVWIEEQDERGKGTGVYLQPVERDEADRVLEEQLSQYRTLTGETLVSRIGEKVEATGVSSQGTPYRITTTVRRYEWQPDTVQLEARLDDGLDGGCRTWKWIDRKLPEVLTSMPEQTEAIEVASS